MKKRNLQKIISLTVGIIGIVLIISGITYSLVIDKSKDKNDGKEENNNYEQYLEGLLSVSYSYPENVIENPDVNEMITKVTSDKEIMKQVLTILEVNKLTTDLPEGGFGGTDMPKVELIYKNKTIRFVFLTDTLAMLFGDVDERQAIYYDIEPLTRLKTLLSGNKVVTRTNLPYYMGIKSISLVRENEEVKTIDSEQEIKKVLALLSSKEESETSNLGGAPSMQLKLNYDDEIITIFWFNGFISISEEGSSISYALSQNIQKQIINMF